MKTLPLLYNHFLPRLYKFITYHCNFHQCIAALTLFLIFQPNVHLYFHYVFLPHLSCVIYTIFWENLITCTKPSAFYCVLCMINRLCYRQRKGYCVYPWFRNALPQPCVSQIFKNKLLFEKILANFASVRMVACMCAHKHACKYLSNSNF